MAASSEGVQCTAIVCVPVLSVVLTRVLLPLCAVRLRRPSVPPVCAISYNSFGATQQQEQSPFAAASSTFAQSPMQMQTQPRGPATNAWMLIRQSRTATVSSSCTLRTRNWMG